MRQIDADALKTDVRRYVLEGTDEFGDITAAIAERSFLSLVDRQPTIEAELVRHGRWVDRYGGKYSNPLYECSECKEIALYKKKKDCLGNDCFEQELSAACPRCRAKMDGGAADDAES